MTSEPLPLEAAMARIRATAEENKRSLQANPAAELVIQQRIAEYEAVKKDDLRRWRNEVLEKCGIPRRMWAELESLKETDAIRAVDNWRKGGKTFLVLEGGVGVGKTYAASHFVAQPGGLFVKTMDIARKSAFDTEGWNQLYTTPFLAIDDLGSEPLDEKGWALSAILGLIDRRYDEAAHTVITTNLSLDQIRKRYGQDGGRLFDRLREAADWVQLGGKSMRRP